MADRSVEEGSVIFSPELFSIQNYGGVARSVMEIIRAIHTQGMPWQVWGGRHGSDPLEALAMELHARDRIHGHYQRKLPGRIAAAAENEWGFRRFLQHQPKAVIHRTQYPVLDMIPQGFRKVSTLHDMWTEREGCSAAERVRSLFKRRALERSDAIVCISQTTRDDLAAKWPHLLDRATVIHHGARVVSRTPKAPGYAWPYFLYVGQRELRKNFPVILHAFAIAREFGDVRLVCVGGGAFTTEEIDLIHALKLSGQMVQRSADDDELAGLYEGAVGLLYPSRFEGFGMPLLEAMLHGCPVISSPLSCLPEIAGEAAIYADADSADSWAAAMEELARDDARRDAMKDRGKARAAEFSWARAGERYAQVYRALL